MNNYYRMQFLILYLEHNIIAADLKIRGGLMGVLGNSTINHQAQCTLNDLLVYPWFLRLHYACNEIKFARAYIQWLVKVEGLKVASAQVLLYLLRLILEHI